MRQHIPNTLTVSNLFCGVLAILAVLQGDWLLTTILVVVSLLADFLDGFVARRLGVSSPMGKELDSMADMVSFGVVPGLIMAWMGGLENLLPLSEATFLPMPGENLLAIGAALLIPVFSAVRLAKFNLDTRQSQYFIGVPTPANTMLVLSLWVIHERHPDLWLSQGLDSPWLIAALSVACSLLLVAELPLLALKFKNFSWAHNRYRYLLILGSAALLLFLRAMAVPLIFGLYLGLSWLGRKEVGE